MWTFVRHVPSLPSVRVHPLRPPWCKPKLTNCKAELGCTSEIRQGYLRDHTLADFSLVLPLEKFSRGGNCVISVSAHVAPLAEHLFHSLSLYFTQFVPWQNNADQVAFQMGGGLSALEQILQVVTVASTPTAAPRIPLKWVPSPHCALLISVLLECIRFLFQARTAGNDEHEEWEVLKILRNVYFGC